MQKSTTHSFNFSNKIELNFDGGKLSSDAGLLLFHEFCVQIGVPELFKELFPENREGVFIHEKPDILYQELIRIIGGYPSNNAAKDLQHDPILREIHGNIASPATCCRLEKTFDKTDLKNFQRLQTKLIDYAYTIEKPDEVIFDLDTTYDPASANIEGANFNTHYKETGFSPLICIEAQTGDLIKAHLRSGNTHCSKKVVPFFKPVLERYQKLKIPVKVRMDSAFATPEIYELCEDFSAKYYIRLKRNNVLERKMFEQLTGDDWINRKEIFTEIRYQAGSWKKGRRVFLHITWPKGKLFPEYAPFVTNDEVISPEDGIKFYRGRAKMERDIDESKNGFSSDHLSHYSFTSNMVRYQLFVLAQLVVNLFRRLTFPDEQKSWLITTIRFALTKVAAKVVRNARKIIFKCASCCPYKDLFITILHNIQALPRFG